MTSEGASFLPRIESIFYAVFDIRQGPKIVHQVPEGLIGVPTSVVASQASSSTSSLFSPSPASSTPSLVDIDTSNSHGTSTAVSPPSVQRSERYPRSPQKQKNTSPQFLFNFDDISKYVIPPSALYGRLVACATRKYRIVGFPVELKGNYERNYFRYNLCFVFERTADLSCYEPVVRKVSRVLTTCEVESKFLSSPQNSSVIYAILEQLYEDLNSYSETSIPIDRFNSIELKLSPFYPNPPVVKDWMVPVALINLTRRIEPNWDLTVAKVCQYIDGINHVSRIARLAECDLDLTRQAISHLLHYQVIMTTDIFQFSNMYTLRKSIQWLADELHVKDECGPYVSKPGTTVCDWSMLLHLYSRLKPGKTVFEWMVEHDINNLGIDVRRFTSFGVVKGFLRRVHRWPVLLPNAESLEKRSTDSLSIPKKQEKNDLGAAAPVRPEPDQRKTRSYLQEALPTIASAGAELVPVKSTKEFTFRRVSAAESSLEALRNRHVQKAENTSSGTGSRTPRPYRSGSGAGRDNFRRQMSQDGAMYSGMKTTVSSAVTTSSPVSHAFKISPDLIGVTDAVDSEHSSGGRSATIGFARPRLNRSPPTPRPQSALSFPAELLPMLDGEHHTDEIMTRFEVGWPVLEKWLVAAGGGQGDGDFGRVSMIYR